MLLAACARPVGDLGRAAPDMLHDSIMPAIGEQRARLAGEPVSDFNRTDEENEMHNRIWRFLVAPRTADWFADTAVELRRTRLAGAHAAQFDATGYYRWLHETHYRSSSVRYGTLADDVEADLDTLADTFASICAVRKIDRQREIAGGAIAGLGPKTGAEIAARRAENEAEIGWFTEALTDRYRAYNYALDHLLVETPDPAGRRADERLADLGAWVQRAEAGAFCHGAKPHDRARRAGSAPRSRYALPVGPVLGS